MLNAITVACFAVAFYSGACSKVDLRHELRTNEIRLRRPYSQQVMADTAVRILRDGGAEGEGGVTVLVADTISAIGGPRVFRHLLRSMCLAIAGGRSHGRGVAVAALEAPPEVYWGLLPDQVGRATGGESAALPLPPDWFQVVDCYTDPLGWASLPSPDRTSPAHLEIETSLRPVNVDQATNGTEAEDRSHASRGELSKGDSLASCKSGKGPTRVFSSVADLDCLKEVLVAAGKDAISGGDPKSKFYLVLDSVSTLLRHSTIFSLASFLDSLRWSDSVSGILLMVHADLHQSHALSTLQYLTNATLFVEPFPQLYPPPLQGTGPSRQPAGRSRAEQGPAGIVRLRQKRRTGKVREQVEAYHLEAGETITFSNLVVPPVSIPVDEAPAKSTKPVGAAELPFNLELTEKEKADRAKVVLPYEHQGFGRKIEIYDGRRDRGAGKEPFQIEVGAQSGHIHYTRDSDDEQPDSDEDPDDDLDI